MRLVSQISDTFVRGGSYPKNLVCRKYNIALLYHDHEVSPIKGQKI